MSTDPTTNNTSSGLTSETTSTTGRNDQVGTEGIVPTVLSYVGLGGNNNQSHSSTTQDAHLHPHDETSARGVAERATGGVTSGYGDGSGLQGNTGVSSDKVRDTTGVGAVGNDSYASGGRSTAGLGSGAGLGNDSYSSGDRSASGVGSGVGLNDTSRSSTAGLGSSNANLNSKASGAHDDSSAGLEGTTYRDETRKTERASSGVAPGSEASESQATTEQRNPETKSGGSRGKLENKDAIPIAGGVKLGEKHWGESEIIPDNPKPKPDAGVSSSEGQPDQPTRDNTSANTGGASNPQRSGSGEKEGIMGKVKDKLNIGHKE